ncbi:HNH endonuclease family protein [Gordonia sp. CNJ-863]|uniref:HNH endonuclease family protein n=1 Tax=Gordonia sp. CNJ-863 TaxID=1904963 RepID=UPI0021CB720E|nr:HNH endonuclease family protein [Gordonia sp. CNJ-863]
MYEDNADVTRFLLTSLAERGMTKETKQDLWARDKKNSYYIWTIEHILPQGKNLPDSWKTMLGGDAAATEAQDSHVHQLGNLTITGYNTSLGNKSFSEKKDRKDANGNYIGYRNGIRLNEDVVSEDEWTVAFIEKRTLSLAEQVLKAFPLAISDQGLNR